MIKTADTAAAKERPTTVRYGSVMEPNHWSSVERPEQIVPAGREPMPDAAERLQGLLERWAATFAEDRFGTRAGIELRLGRRGLVADEAASFLQGLDAGLLVADELGGVRAGSCRPKPGGGRYSLFTANRHGGNAVTLNTEYLIQLGATCELATVHGWPGGDVAVEVGEFDALAYADDRVVVAMEAKARIDGPDSLTGLWTSLVGYFENDEPPAPETNHSRKYVELLRLTETGPVVLWLVAAQARWPALARRIGSRIEFHPVASVDRAEVVRATSTTPAEAVVVEPGTAAPPLEPNTDHALAVARLTELDGQQRCYEYSWRDEAQLREFLNDLRVATPDGAHTRPWVWRADRSTGSPMTPSGRSTGLEVRFSYYAN